MWHRIGRGAVAVVGTLVLVFAALPANANHFNPFDVQESGIPGSSPNLMTNLGQFNFNYTNTGIQTITDVGGVSFAGPGDTFVETGSATVSGWINNDVGHTTHSPTQLNGLEPGGYKMYATFTLTGEADFGGNPNEIHGIFDAGTPLTLWVDPLSNTTLDAAGNVTGGGADDFAVALGTLIEGESFIRCADISATECTAAPGQALGDFKGLYLFNLTAAGSLIFVNPDPFYAELSFAGNTTTITGDVNCTVDNQPCTTVTTGAGNVFLIQVPQPASLLLLGGSLVALGILRRRFFRA